MRINSKKDFWSKFYDLKDQKQKLVQSDTTGQARFIGLPCIEWGRKLEKYSLAELNDMLMEGQNNIDHFKKNGKTMRIDAYVFVKETKISNEEFEKAGAEIVEKW